MKCELLAEQNLALMLDFVDDENTKYDEAVLKAFLNEKTHTVILLQKMEKQSDLLTVMFCMSQTGRKYTICMQLTLWKDGRSMDMGRNLSGLFMNIRKPWAAAKCFCLPISAMLPPAGVTGKQEEFAMPLQMISCLCSGNVPGSSGLPGYLTEKETREISF